MRNNTIICTAKDLAAIVAGLVREGVTFEAVKIDYHLLEDAYEIALTGGY